jgi:hypothetical protein
MVSKRVILVFLAVLAGMWPHLAGAAQVSAVPDRDRVAAGESLRLELRVTGSPDSDPDLSPLDRDWEILGRSQSSQVQIINGHFSRSLTCALTLMPRREGEIPIPPICFSSDCSEPLTIRVTAADQAPQGKQGLDLLLETESAPDRLYTQQQLIFTVRLLHRDDLLRGSLSEPSVSGVDAAVQKLGDDRTYETRRNGLLYQVVERRYAVFPQTSGTLRIAPLRFEGEISRGVPRFDPFGAGGRRIRRDSAPLQIRVLPPPSDRNGRPWLPARSLRLQDPWQGRTQHLTLGEPATRTLTLRAEGLQAAQLPELPFSVPPEFKSYPDQPGRRDETGDHGISGELQQKIALIPTRPGRYRLPAVDLDWWDVTTGQWQRAHLDPVEIEVAPAAGGSADGALPVPQPSPPAGASPSAPAPVTPAPPAAAPAARGGPPSSSSPGPGLWPWLSLGLGLGWLVTLVLCWRKRKGTPDAGEAGAEAPRLREREARKAVLQAARGADPQAARQTLVVWGQALDSGPAGLEGLGRLIPALQPEIDRLNRALYAPGREPWNGDGLSRAIRHWEAQRRERPGNDRLPGLYPTSTRNDPEQ